MNIDLKNILGRDNDLKGSWINYFPFDFSISSGDKFLILDIYPTYGIKNPRQIIIDVDKEKVIYSNLITDDFFFTNTLDDINIYSFGFGETNKYTKGQRNLQGGLKPDIEHIFTSEKRKKINTSILFNLNSISFLKKKKYLIICSTSEKGVDTIYLLDSKTNEILSFKELGVGMEWIGKSLQISPSEDYFTIAYSQDLFVFSLTDFSLITKFYAGFESKFYKNYLLLFPIDYGHGIFRDNISIYDFTNRKLSILAAIDTVENTLSTILFPNKKNAIFPYEWKLFPKSNLLLILGSGGFKAFKLDDFIQTGCLKEVNFRLNFIQPLLKNDLTIIAFTLNNEGNYFYLINDEFQLCKMKPEFNNSIVREYELPKKLNKNSYGYKPELPLYGNWYQGFALDEHTVKSTLKENGYYDTERTEIGELLYQIKYQSDFSKINDLISSIDWRISTLFRMIDVIIPVPPSNTNRNFQPVEEIALKISEALNCKCDTQYLIKTKKTQPLKEIDEKVNRELELSDAFTVVDNRYKDKILLLFDDLYRSGATLNSASKVIKEEGEIRELYVLTLTKTRTKR